MGSRLPITDRTLKNFCVKGFLLIKNFAQKASYGFTVAIMFLLFFALLRFSSVSRAYAAISETINFQGKLTNVDGTNFTGTCGTSCKFEFSIYDATSAGNQLWSEEQTGVSVVGGIFNVKLGSVNAFSSTSPINYLDSSHLDNFNKSPLYLQINVDANNNGSYDANEVFSTRLLLTSVPYAWNAANLGGRAASGFVQLASGVLQWDTSTNNSIYLNKTGVSGNLLQLQKNGSDAFVVNNTGFVGIGTASPANNLQVVHSANNSGGIRVTDANGLAINITASKGNTALPFIGSFSNHPLTLGANNTEYIRILTGGNVGIGTTAPTDMLDISGGVKIGAGYAGVGTAPTNGLLVQGNMGIGTASPAGSLHIQNSANTISLSLRSTSTVNSIIQFSTNAGTNYIGVDDANSGLTLGGTIDQIGSSNYTMLVQSNAGNVGIGTIVPTAKLHIVGTSNTQQLIVKANATQTANLTEWQNSSGTIKAAIDSGGRLSLGGAVPDPLIIFNGNNSDTFNSASLVRGISFETKNSGAGSITGLVPNATTSYPGSVSSIKGVSTSLATSNSSTVVGSSYGLEVTTPTITAGAITNSYGLYIQDHNNATNNYAIYTNLGLNRLGDRLVVNAPTTTSASGAFEVTETKNPTATGGYSFAKITGTVSMPSNIGVAQDYYGLNTTISVTNANYTTSNTQLRSLYLSAQNSNPNTISIMYGGYVDLYNFGAGTVSSMYGYGGALRNNGTGTIGTATFLNIGDVANTGGGTVNYQYGIRIASQTKGSILNYAIYTGSGLNSFGDQLSIVGSANRQQLIVKGNATQTTNLTEWQNSSGTVLASITGTGSLGIGRTPATNKLEVEGDASKTTASSWLANSDQRIKKDITGVEGLDFINQLNPVKFRYTDEYMAQHPGIENKMYYNFVAQEYANVFPDSVKGSGEFLPDGSEILQLDSYNANIVAIKAIQELDVKTTQIENNLAQVVSKQNEVGGSVPVIVVNNDTSGTNCVELPGTDIGCIVEEVRTNVVSVENGLSVVSLLKPITFTVNGQVKSGFDNMEIDSSKLIPYLVSSIQKQQSAIQNLETRMLEIDQKFANKLTLADLEVSGKIGVGNDSAGVAKIIAGQKEVRVTFTSSYETTPIISVTRYGVADGTLFSVKDITVEGFTIEINSVSLVDESFGWIAVVNN